MAKMVAGVIATALLIYVSWFVRLGELTFREHLVRIARTPEVQDLGQGIVSKVGSATSQVKHQISARLHATKAPSQDLDAPDLDEDQEEQ